MAAKDVLSEIRVIVEVARNPKSQSSCSETQRFLISEFKNLSPNIFLNSESFKKLSDIQDLERLVNSMRVYVEPEDYRFRLGAKELEAVLKMTFEETQSQSSTSLKGDQLPLPLVNLHVFVFDLSEGGEEEEYMEDDEDETNSSPTSHSSILPSKGFQDLWDSLYFESNIKSRLLSYVDSAFLFSERGVNTSLVSLNKVVLLHGPAGSGKTSLCKALAQKATIRLSGRYDYGQLVEINSHSLFSKWFSESGKLVMKMFDQIHELIQNPKALIFLLIDEVESLAKCRRSSEAGNEPGDSLRAVNALLTQLDKIKKYPNVMILTTSNMVGSIDNALLDRADMKIYIGPPPVSVIYKIYATSINELIRVGIIHHEVPLPIEEFETTKDPNVESLYEIAKCSEFMSGRSLRKLPFLAHSNFLDYGMVNCPLREFLIAMTSAARRERIEFHALKNHND